ncbi:MAG: adenylate/guanylate cyclase domain-containing protein [Candidatus Hodarchaeales archaeon]|jgi:adenylate cyclase
MSQKNSFGVKTIEELLPKYVCHRCVDKVLEYNRKGTFGGEIMFMTIMFVDIHGFSTIAEKLGPEEAMKVLNNNYHLMIESLFKCKAAILKFIGDGMLVAFGLPKPKKDDVERAICCAVKLQKDVNELQKPLKKDKRIKIGIGMHSGDVVLGNVGHIRRLDFTIIGDAVNIASRLADLARANEILVSEDTLAKLTNNMYETEYVEDFIPRGMTKKINYYRIENKQVDYNSSRIKEKTCRKTKCVNQQSSIF